MNWDIPGRTSDARMKAAQRDALEIQLQNLLGPIANIKDLTDAELYGLRDELRAQQKIVGEAFQ